jgi:ABC-2 type transport system ATP-binding protein
MRLEINNISKKFNSNKYGLTNFTLKLENGILGLLGPNGAGKSTLMKIIATVSRPTEGTVTLDGIDITKNPDYIRRMLGYLPQDFGVYPNLNAYEFLRYMAAMKGVGGPGLSNLIAQLLEGVNLTAAAKTRIGTYSGGMKQRIGIAQALLNSPKILILDEPTVGLDPEERVRFRNLLSELAGDCIVILSSHIVSDIVTIADEVAIMKEGKLLKNGYQPDIIEIVTNKVYETEIDKEDVTAFKKQHLVINTIRNKVKAHVRFTSDSQIAHSTLATASLEDAYLYLTSK